MTDAYCPRCAARRPDAFRWCRKCGLDFQNPPKQSDPSPPRTSMAPASLDVRPVNDRRNMARVAGDALTVRCLGTVGGLIGLFIGFLIGSYVGLVIGGAAPILTIPFGLLVGLFAGMRIALALLAR